VAGPRADNSPMKRPGRSGLIARAAARSAGRPRAPARMNARIGGSSPRCSPPGGRRR